MAPFVEAVISAPPFRPLTRPPNTPSPLTTPDEPWVELLVSNCHFGIDAFLATLKELCLHPERNSGLILRADPLPLKEVSPDHEGTRLGLELSDQVRVRLMPKQPGRDAKLEQQCLFFRTSSDQSHDVTTETRARALMVYAPEVKDPAELPFYYPPVRRLAYLWEEVTDPNDAPTEGVDADAPVVRGRISIAYLPWPPELNQALARLHIRPLKAPRKRSPLAGPAVAAGALPTNETSVASSSPSATILPDGKVAQTGEERLFRTCLGLLERVYKHGYGTQMGYKKRVHHDVVVPRESFQDLYRTLKDRHKHLDSRVNKPGSTKIEDVKRHVWKEPGLPDDPLLPSVLSYWGSQDVAIASFLMLLWKEMYPAREVTEPLRNWDTWGRPPNGFLDLGCGNGLLVHILVSEGYDGKGFELRARKTWPGYPPKTQAALVELPIDLPSWFPETLEQWKTGSWPGKETCMVREGTFIIGNHADELTPWIPLLSLLPAEPVPFLSLPCCLHTLDAKFDQLVFVPPAHPRTPASGFDEGLESGQSRYKAYLMWLGYCGLLCGWEWEKEPLRVPSTKGWGIVGRKRWSPNDDWTCREWALEQVNSVRSRGAFKVRVREGKEH